jgi:hypothetical protein
MVLVHSSVLAVDLTVLAVRGRVRAALPAGAAVIAAVKLLCVVVGHVPPQGVVRSWFR